MKRVMTLLLILVLMLFLAAGCGDEESDEATTTADTDGSAAPAEAVEVAQEYIDAMNAGDCVRMLSVQGKEPEDSFYESDVEDCEERLAKHEDLGELQSTEVEEQIMYSIIFNREFTDGSQQYVVTVVQEDGEWVLDSTSYTNSSGSSGSSTY